MNASEAQLSLDDAFCRGSKPGHVATEVAVSLCYQLHVVGDVDLLEAWQAGDDAAGNELLRRHFESLYYFFFNKVDEVDDLVQTTLLAAVEGRDRVRDPGAFKGYLLAIARRQLAEHWRKKGRIRRYEDLERMSAAQLSNTPSRVAASRQQERILLQALRQISVPHQTIVELYYWQELSVQEMALALEIAPGTVKSRLARARDALAEQLGAATGTDGRGVELEDRLRATKARTAPDIPPGS